MLIGQSTWQLIRLKWIYYSRVHHTISLIKYPYSLHFSVQQINVYICIYIRRMHMSRLTVDETMSRLVSSTRYHCPRLTIYLSMVCVQGCQSLLWTVAQRRCKRCLRQSLTRSLTWVRLQYTTPTVIVIEPWYSYTLTYVGCNFPL